MREAGRESSAAAGDDGAPHRKVHLPGLDGIRGIAIGLVLFSHSVINDEFSSLRAIGLHAGSAGVVIFFVLSGYLITTLLLQEEASTGRIALGLFYARRALRLFPALWLYLLALAAIGLAGGLPDHPWHSFVSSLLYVRNLVGRGHETSHLWSLAVEEQFYLVWPLALVVLPRRGGIRLVAALGGFLGVTAWRAVAARNGLVPQGTIYIRTDFRFDGPLLGCVLALLLRSDPWTLAWTHSTALRSAALAIGGTLGLGAWLGLRLGEAVPPGTDATVVAAFGAVLILSQVGTPGPASRWLAWGPLVALGQVSYGVYLWQQLFLGHRAPGFEIVRRFPLGLLATALVALASYRLLERPLLRLKDRLHQPPVA